MIETATIYGFEFEGKIVYVGSTIRDVRTRICRHYEFARGFTRNKKPTIFQEFLKEKNPPVNFKILEICDVQKRFERETFFINQFDTIVNGFNKEISGEAEEKKLSAGRPKGCKNPTGKDHYLFGVKGGCPKATEASVKARIGKKLSDETRQKMREGHARRKQKMEKNLHGHLTDQG